MKKGFTLVELLVVIAIIAILTGIILPVFSTARAKARQATCSTNLMELSSSIAMYMSDYDQRLIPCISKANMTKNNIQNDQMLVNYTFGGVTVDDCWAWSTVLYPYVKKQSAFYCPSSMIEVGQEIDTGVKASTYNTGYGINIDVTGGTDKDVIFNGSKITGVRPPLLAKFHRTSDIYLIADCSSCGLFGYYINKYVKGEGVYIPGSYATTEDAISANIQNYAEDAVDARHGKGYINMLYLDGHTKLVYGSDVLKEVNNKNSVPSKGDRK